MSEINYSYQPSSTIPTVPQINGQTTAIQPVQAAAPQVFQEQQANQYNVVTNMPITTIEEIKRYAAGVRVNLPPFGDDMPFVAQIRRVSMLMMMKSGKIPNQLLGAANSLFAGNDAQLSQEDDTLYKQIAEVAEIMAEACLVSPSYQDIRSAGLELTDQQLMTLFNYTQVGARALLPFRGEQTNNSASAQSL